MAKRDELFDLISTLTPNEKRYFKLQAGLQSGEKEYMLVFDAMAKQKEYNEAAITRILQEHQVRSPLFRIKHYLYNQLLRGLKAMDKLEDEEMKLLDLAQETWILYHKKLPEQALKRAQKAVKLAARSELRIFEAYFTDFIIEILSRSESGTPKHDKVKELYDEAQTALHLAATNMKYAELKKRMFILLRLYGTLPSAENKRLITELKEDPYLKDENLAVDFLARYNFYQAHFFYYVSMDNYDDAYQSCRQQVAWFEKNPEKIEALAANYAIALNNYISAAMTANEIDLAEELLEKLEAQPVKGNLEQANRFTFVYFTRMEIAFVRRRYDAMLRYMEDTREELERLKHSLGHFRMAGIKLLIAKALTFSKRPNEALDHLKEAIEPLLEHQYPRMIVILRIQEILAHFMLGNYKLIEHLVRSISRQKLTGDSLHEYEKEMLNGLRKAANEKDNDKRKDILNALRRSLTVWYDNGSPSSEPGYHFRFDEYLGLLLQ